MRSEESRRTPHVFPSNGRSVQMPSRVAINSPAAGNGVAKAGSAAPNAAAAAVEPPSRSARQPRRGQSTTTSADWDLYRPIISTLYVDEQRTLKEVMEHMNERYGFQATAKMYKIRLRAWKLAKNVRTKDAVAIMDSVGDIEGMVKQHGAGDASPDSTQPRSRSTSQPPDAYYVDGRYISADKFQRYLNQKTAALRRRLRQQARPGSVVPLGLVLRSPERLSILEDIAATTHAYLESAAAKWAQIEASRVASLQVSSGWLTDFPSGPGELAVATGKASLTTGGLIEDFYNTFREGVDALSRARALPDVAESQAQQQEAFAALNSSFALIQPALEQQHPLALAFVFCLLAKCRMRGLDQLAGMLLAHVAELSLIVLGPTHPMPRLLKDLLLVNAMAYNEQQEEAQSQMLQAGGEITAGYKPPASTKPSASDLELQEFISSVLVEETCRHPVLMEKSFDLINRELADYMEDIAPPSQVQDLARRSGVVSDEDTGETFQPLKRERGIIDMLYTPALPLIDSLWAYGEAAAAEELGFRPGDDLSASSSPYANAESSSPPSTSPGGASQRTDSLSSTASRSAADKQTEKLNAKCQLLWTRGIIRHCFGSRDEGLQLVQQAVRFADEQWGPRSPFAVGLLREYAVCGPDDAVMAGVERRMHVLRSWMGVDEGMGPTASAQIAAGPGSGGSSPDAAALAGAGGEVTHYAKLAEASDDDFVRYRTSR